MRDSSYINLKWICFHLQTRPVPFTVRAVVTSSDIEFNVQDIDFGFCSVFESVRQTVTITNKSVLPQQFGFCGVPDVSANCYEGIYLFWFITVFIKILFWGGFTVMRFLHLSSVEVNLHLNARVEESFYFLHFRLK